MSSPHLCLNMLGYCFPIRLKAGSWKTSSCNPWLLVNGKHSERREGQGKSVPLNGAHARWGPLRSYSHAVSGRLLCTRTHVGPHVCVRIRVCAVR